MTIADRIVEFLWVFRSGRCQNCGSLNTSIELAGHGFKGKPEWFCSWTCFCKYYKEKLR